MAPLIGLGLGSGTALAGGAVVVGVVVLSPVRRLPFELRERDVTVGSRLTQGDSLWACNSEGIVSGYPI